MPKVSVLLATYNCKKTVADSIESILSQTYDDWNCIICDDCSTDGTYDAVVEYSKKYPDKFIVMRNEVNSKLSFSLNRCIGAADGEYLARMDGDDISLEQRFKKQVDFLDAHKDIDAVGSVTTLFDENGDYGLASYPEYPDKFTLYHQVPFAHPAVMVRKSAYEKLGGYTVSERTVRSQDYDLWFRFFAAGMKGYNIQEPLLRFREDKNAVKRRTAKVRMNATKTLLIGYKMLNYPLYYYPKAFKPVLKIIIPTKLIYRYHHRADKD